MPEVLFHQQSDEAVLAPGIPAAVPAITERRARDDLRDQIARLELRLGELFASAFPRQGIDWRIGTVGGPRLLGISELERIRDALAFRLSEAQAQLSAQVDTEEESRGVLEAMIAEPERYPWVRVSNEQIGERGCRHWHSRPRWGILGMLLGWWRVKLSSGCPLAKGPRPPEFQETSQAPPPSLGSEPASGRAAAARQASRAGGPSAGAVGIVSALGAGDPGRRRAFGDRLLCGLGPPTGDPAGGRLGRRLAWGA